MKTEITTKTSDELAYLREDDPEMMGTEEIERGDVKLPRLKLVQGTTKEKFGADPGELIHSVTGKNYGKSMLIIAIVFWKSNIKFDKQMQIECQSLDHKVNMKGDPCLECGQNKFGADGQVPTCNEGYNFMIAEKDELAEAIKEKRVLSPLVLSFMRSAVPTARTMLTAIKLNVGRQFPIYCQYFDLNIPAEPKDFGTGSAFVPKVAIKSYATPEEKEYLKSLHVEFSKLRRIVDVSPDDVGGSGEEDDKV